MNFSRPFPPREFADRGAKWLLRHPGHLRHLLRILAVEVSDRVDFERLAPCPPSCSPKVCKSSWPIW